MLINTTEITTLNLEGKWLKICENKIGVWKRKCSTICSSEVIECPTCGNIFDVDYRTVMTCRDVDPRKIAEIIWPEKPKNYISQFVLIRLFLWTYISAKYGKRSGYLWFLEEMKKSLEPYALEKLNFYIAEMEERDKWIDIEFSKFELVKTQPIKDDSVLDCKEEKQQAGFL